MTRARRRGPSKPERILLAGGSRNVFLITCLVGVLLAVGGYFLHTEFQTKAHECNLLNAAGSRLGGNSTSCKFDRAAHSAGPYIEWAGIGIVGIRLLLVLIGLAVMPRRAWRMLSGDGDGDGRRPKGPPPPPLPTLGPGLPSAPRLPSQSLAKRQAPVGLSASRAGMARGAQSGSPPAGQQRQQVPRRAPVGAQQPTAPARAAGAPGASGERRKPPGTENLPPAIAAAIIAPGSRRARPAPAPPPPPAPRPAPDPQPASGGPAAGGPGWSPLTGWDPARAPGPAGAAPASPASQTASASTAPAPDPPRVHDAQPMEPIPAALAFAIRWPGGASPPVADPDADPAAGEGADPGGASGPDAQPDPHRAPLTEMKRLAAMHARGELTDAEHQAARDRLIRDVLDQS